MKLLEARSRRNSAIFIAVAAVTILIDQVLKALVVAYVTPDRPITLIPHVLQITNVRNPGAAFGLFAGSSQIIFLVAMVIIVIALVWFFKSSGDKRTSSFVALGLMIGGAMGNLLDRLFRGKVVDFIDLGWWPVFNVADLAIVGGVIILVITMVLDVYRPVREQPEKAGGE